MAEYIKREDAVSHPFANGRYDKKNANLDFILGHESYKEWLENLPVVDVRENVRGEWVDDGFLGRKTCSVCGAWIANNTGTAELNYCPNCGADMRGDKVEP